jgi:hypothetical protein
MSIFQMGAVLFALFMLYVVNIHRRKLQLSRAEVFFWYSIWLLFMVVSIFPQLLVGIAQRLNFARVFDFLVVVALMIITIIVITNYFIQRDNAQKLEDLVRDIAIKQVKNKKTRSTRKS